MRRVGDDITNDMVTVVVNSEMEMEIVKIMLLANNNSAIANNQRYIIYSASLV